MEEIIDFARRKKVWQYILKIIPMWLAFIALLNTVLSYFCIDVPLLSYLGGVSLLPLIFLYIASYTFKFCFYHRIFLHYVTFNWLFNIIDYYIGIPFISDKGVLLLGIILFGLSCFIALYYHQKERQRIKLLSAKLKKNYNL